MADSKNTQTEQLLETTVMQSVTATDLRIGNLYEYFISDKNDDRKEWWEAVVCDAQDLVYLEKNPNDRDFRLLLLTKEWFDKLGMTYYSLPTKSDRKIGYYTIKYGNRFKINSSDGKYYFLNFRKEIKYVHELQNLYFSLTGHELTIA